MIIVDTCVDTHHSQNVPRRRGKSATVRLCLDVARVIRIRTGEEDDAAI